MESHLAEAVLRTYTWAALRASHWLGVFRLLTLLALGVSAALLVDYLNPQPSFCGGGSGCEQIRDSGVGTFLVLGVPVHLPVVGVFAFAGLFGLSLARSERVLGRILEPLSIFGGVCGLGFIAWQGYLGSFCSLCLAVDISAICLAICAVVLHGSGWGEALAEEQSQTRLLSADEMRVESQSVPAVWRDDSQIYQPPNPLVRPAPKHPVRLLRSAWLSLGVLFVTAPLLYPKVVAISPVPSSIQELYDESQPTIVEFFDFQCPHCRDLSPRLKELAKRNGVPLVLGYRPLGFPGSEIAARMSICAAEQGKEAELAGRFFKQADFSAEALERTALDVIEDEAAFKECLASERPDQRIARDTERLEDAGFRGLPTTFIGSEKILGAHPDSVYSSALQKARDGGLSGLPPVAFWAVILVLFAAIVWSGWAGPPSAKSEPNRS